MNAHSSTTSITTNGGRELLSMVLLHYQVSLAFTLDSKKNNKKITLDSKQKIKMRFEIKYHENEINNGPPQSVKFGFLMKN